MRLNSLSLCNFRQHADTRIAFDSGLTGIIGPNGSGKTTILEGIAWAVRSLRARAEVKINEANLERGSEGESDGSTAPAPTRRRRGL